MFLGVQSTYECDHQMRYLKQDNIERDIKPFVEKKTNKFQNYFYVCKDMKKSE